MSETAALSGPIRVLVVDDHGAVRAGLAALLGAAEDIRIVGEAGTGQAALSEAARLRPDIVLIDVQMPGMDGIEACRHLSANGTARVIVLTTFGIDEYVDAALAAGASAFLVKSASASALIDAVRRVHAGESVLAPEVTRGVIERLAAARAAAPPVQRREHPALAALTPRERDVLALLGSGASNAEIAHDLVISAATAKTHVSRILDKLGVGSRVQAALIARDGLGPGTGP